ncbi:MAG: response regulator [Holophagaceae bacterium]|nr:response regulator [Holophagaceae bacterium]
MPRIHIIDDDPTIRLSTELLLGALGFETESSENGIEGLARLQERPPDLVVCDIVMPGLDGFGVLAAAQQEPRLARVPFIFLTSLTDRDTQRRGMTAGADDFLTKPFHPTELVDAIQARFRKLTTHGPGEAAMELALTRVRGLLSGREQALLGLGEPGAVAPEPAAEAPDPAAAAARRWAEGWIERVRRVFDEHNPKAILYLKDRVRSKKQTIHATYLLSRLYFKLDDRPHAEAEFAVAESVLKLNIGLFRSAIEAENHPATAGRYPGLRARILRLERKLESLRQERFD